MADQTAQVAGSIDAERERLYAQAKALGLAWAALRRRVWLLPEPDLSDVPDLPDTDEVNHKIEIESETVNLLQQLADLFEGEQRGGADA